MSERMIVVSTDCHAGLPIADYKPFLESKYHAMMDLAVPVTIEMMDKAEMIVVVSHDLEAIARMCEVGVWLDHGRIRQIGPIDGEKVKHLRPGREVFSASASLIFKKTQVVRFYDPKRNVLVYLTYTDRVIDGQPRNSISVVPVNRGM